MSEEERMVEDAKKDGVVLQENSRCPICGHDFDPVRPVNVCPTQHYGQQEFVAEELIGDDDDYMWCQ